MPEIPLIQHIQVHNFRSIKDAVIKDLPQIMGIWGPNGSGKSNLLQALYYFSGEMSNSAQGIKLNLYHISSLNELFNKHISGERQSVIIYNRGVATKEMQLRLNNNGSNEQRGAIPRQDAIYLPPWRHILDKNSSLGYGTSLSSLIFTHDGNITQNFIQDQISQLTSAVAGGDHDAKLVYQMITDWSQSVGLGRITPKLHGQETTTAYLDAIDGQMDVPDAGFGGRSALPIIILTTLTDNKLILIEEPEISLHPAAQANMAERFVEVAKKRNHQIFFTSHSEYLLRRFTRMAKDKEIDAKIFKAMKCEKTEKLGSIYTEIDQKQLISNFNSNRP